MKQQTSKSARSATRRTKHRATVETHRSPLADTRESQKLSQFELAKRAGCSPGAIASIEQRQRLGVHCGSAELFSKLARVMKRPAEELSTPIPLVSTRRA